MTASEPSAHAAARSCSLLSNTTSSICVQSLFLNGRDVYSRWKNNLSRFIHAVQITEITDTGRSSVGKQKLVKNAILNINLFLLGASRVDLFPLYFSTIVVASGYLTSLCKQEEGPTDYAAQSIMLTMLTRFDLVSCDTWLVFKPLRAEFNT